MSSKSDPPQQEIDRLIGHYNLGDFCRAEELARSFTVKFSNYAFGWKVLGAILQQSGRFDESLTAFRKCIYLSQNDEEAYNNLGIVWNNLGNIVKAEECFRKAMDLNSNYYEAYNNLGNSLKHRGEFIEAEKYFMDAINIRPEFFQSYYNLANTFLELRKFEEAEIYFRRAIALNYNFAEAHNNLALILKETKRLAQAEISFTEALRLKPSYADAYYNLGLLQLEVEKIDRAEVSFKKAISIKPNFAEAYFNLGNILLVSNRLDEALVSFLQAIKLKPDYFEYYYNLGIVYKELLQLEPAYKCFSESIKLEPNFSAAYNNLGYILHLLGQFQKAEYYYTKAIDIDPDVAEAHNNLGNLYRDLGRFEEAETSYKMAMRIKPSYFEAHSNFLLTLNHKHALSPRDILREAKIYGENVSKNAKKKFSSWNYPDNPKKLRIGFVSGDFRNHPVGYFIEALLSNIDKEKFEIYGYSSNKNIDDLTSRIIPFFKKWQSLIPKNDFLSAQLIYQDALHILIDLSGHTAMNRLPVFSYKPAPIQASYLGYFATTGLPEMDYFIGDSYVTPEQEEDHFTESISRLPDTYLCFTPPRDKINIAILPALKNHYITFGCFNNLSKMGEEVVSLWSQILEKLPDSKLFLKTQQLSDESVISRVIEQFADNKISSDRLILEGSSPRKQLLLSYNHVDIALDPFPYPGGTTSAEALWMGVPVLTLKGDRFLSHVGEAIAHNSGYPQWIAHNKEDYLNKAVSLASDLKLLNETRAQLRQNILISPLFNAQKFAKNFEIEMWKLWDTYKKH